MLNYDQLCTKDFYFNGAYLSSMNGVVGDKSGFNNFSVTPTREYFTEKLIGFDGEVFLGSRLAPRVFVIPVFFTSITDATIRNIAAWLDVQEPTQFYFKDDSVYINCILDSNSYDISDLYTNSGKMELKFIAHDPFYYEITASNSTEVLVTGDNIIEITNLGNKFSYPKLTIDGSGTVVVTTYDALGSVKETCTITSVTSDIVIDTLEKRVYTTAGVNKINDMTGSFPIFYTGDIELKISGTVTSVDIEPRFRWI